MKNLLAIFLAFIVSVSPAVAEKIEHNNLIFIPLPQSNKNTNSSQNLKFFPISPVRSSPVRSSTVTISPVVVTNKVPFTNEKLPSASESPKEMQNMTKEQARQIISIFAEKSPN